MSSKTLTFIIVALVVISQVIGAIVEKANKAKQEQRLRDVAAKRRRQTARSGDAGAPTMAPAPHADKATDLAARRRAQLEELRQRRRQRQGPTTARAPAAPGTTTRAPAPAPPSPFRVPQPPPRGTPSRPVPGRRTPVVVQQRPPRRAPVARRPAEPVERAVATPSDEAQRISVKPEPAAKPIPNRLPLRGDESWASALRRIIVLREILEPPVALRQDDVWNRV